MRRLIFLLILAGLAFGLYKWYYPNDTPAVASNPPAPMVQQPQQPVIPVVPNNNVAANNQAPPPPMSNTERVRLSLKKLFVNSPWSTSSGHPPDGARNAAAAVGITRSEPDPYLTAPERPTPNILGGEPDTYAADEPPAAPAPPKSTAPTRVELPPPQIIVIERDHERDIPVTVYHQRRSPFHAGNLGRYCERKRGGWCCPDGFHADEDEYGSVSYSARY